MGNLAGYLELPREEIEKAAALKVRASSDPSVVRMFV